MAASAAIQAMTTPVPIVGLMWVTLRAMSWQVIAKGLLIAGQIYAARILGPEELGRGALPVAIALQAVLLADLGLDGVAVRRLASRQGNMNADEIASAVLALRIPLGCFGATILAGLGFILPEQAWLWWMAALICFFTVLQPLWAFQALQIVPAQHRIAALQSTVQAGLLLGLVRSGSSAEIWMLTLCIAQGIGTICQWLFLRNAGLCLGILPGKGVRQILLREGRPLWLICILAGIYTGWDLPIVALWLGSEAAGVYRAALTPLHIVQPIILVISGVSFPKIAEWLATPTAAHCQFIIRWWKWVAILGVCVCGISLSMPIIVEFLFGSSFKGAGSVSRILMLGKGVV